MVRQEYTNKGEEEGKKGKLMAWVEVNGGQRSLAFELTTANHRFQTQKIKDKSTRKAKYESA